MTTEHYIEDSNLSIAWARALIVANRRGYSEIAPLVVSITGFDDEQEFVEEPGIRALLDGLLKQKGLRGVDTVASTIFPQSMWNPKMPRQALFARYGKIASHLKEKWPANRHGLYFERMIMGGPKGKENQLDFAIDTYMSRKGVRRSVLQVAVFDPSRDHSAAAQLGFPCLQHVTFAPVGNTLCVNAFYATQYLVERAYGNYVGLCRLGRFVSHEMGLRLTRVTCFTGIAEVDTPKRELKDILATAKGLLTQKS